MSFFSAFEDRRDEDDFDDFELVGDAGYWESWWCEACGIEWSLNYPACPSCGAFAPLIQSIKQSTPTPVADSKVLIPVGTHTILATACDFVRGLDRSRNINDIRLVEDDGFFLDPLPNSYEHADDTTRVCPTCCAILLRAQTFCHGCHQVS